MLTIATQWLARARMQTETPVVRVTVIANGNLFRAALSPRYELGFPNSIVEVNGIGTELDPFTRETSVSEFELVFARDGLLKQWLDTPSVTDLNGAEVAIRLGWLGLDPFYDVTIARGYIEDMIPSRENIVVRVTDAFSVLAQESKFSGDYANLHPLEAIAEVLTDAGRADLTPNDLTYDLDPDRAHYVVGRTGDNNLGREPSVPSNVSEVPDFVKKSISLNNTRPVRAVEPESVIDNVLDLVNLMDGTLLPGDENGLPFKFRPSKIPKFRFPFSTNWSLVTADRHLTESDVSDLKVDENYKVINQIRFRFCHGGVWKTDPLSYTQGVEIIVRDLTSIQTNQKRTFEAELESRWVENEAAFAGVGRGLPLSTGYPFSEDVRGERAGGVCGSLVSKDPADDDPLVPVSGAAVSNDNPAWLLAADRNNTGLECVRASSIDVDVNTIGGTGWTSTRNAPYRYRFTLPNLAARAQMSTAQVEITDISSVVDVTIPLEIAQGRLRRFSEGAPMISFSTSLAQWELEIGDLISVEAPWFFKGAGSLAIRSLDEGEIFEITAKELNLGDEPGIRWQACWVNSAPTFSTIFPVTFRVERGVS